MSQKTLNNNELFDGILTGYRVIDFTTNISGPSATAILADLGADVIKIEKLQKGDDSRSMEPAFVDKSAYFVAINRGKKSMAINLKSSEGANIVKKLLLNSQIVVENSRRGTMEKLGFDYESVKRIKKDIIYASLSSYGDNGPYCDRPGYDAIVQAETGIMSVNGSKNELPARVGISVLDAGSGMWLAMGIILATLKKERTGEGSYISTSLYETGIYWMNYYNTAYQITEKIPEKIGSEHPSFAPYGAFETKNGYIMIGISNDNLFSRLTNSIGHPELATDPFFLSNNMRVKNRKTLNNIMQEIIKQNTKEHWYNVLVKNKIPCAVIKNVEEVIYNEHTEYINPFQTLNENFSKKLKIQPVPLRFNGDYIKIKKSSPALGEDTYDLLGSIGYLEEEIDKLRKSGVIL